ncbi:hypothetical protein C8Q74DRAFT_1394115 [Fomes fomentarius]|nr:hypothetical protein C8Q74DRAFT_1394115 [Fomes fomentarius]
MANNQTHRATQQGSSDPVLLNTLPDCILLEVFHHAQNFLILVRVCRRWCEIVRGAPLLWRTINIHNRLHVNRVGMHLRYSKTTPIDLYIYEPMVDRYHSLALLHPHMNHIRKLHLLAVKLNPDDESVRALLSQDMPILEELALSFDFLRMPYEYLPIFDLIHRGDSLVFSWKPRVDQFPKVRRFSLGRAVSIVGSFPVFPTIRRLDLHDFIPAPFDIVSFVEFLWKLPHLEELSVHKYRPKLVPIATPLSLPATLRKLSIQDNAHYAKPFLASIFIPLHVNLDLTRSLDEEYMYEDDMDEEDEEEEDEEDGRGFTVTKLLPDDRRCLPVLEHVNTITLRVDTEWIYVLEGLTSTGTVAKVSGMLYEHMIPDQCERLHVLDDLVTVFFGAPVVEIRIEQHDRSPIEKRHWIRALRAFPALQCLSLEHTSIGYMSDARRTLLEVLRMRTRKQGSGSAPFAMWPQLRSLTLPSDFHSSDEARFLDELVNCLQLREAGGSRLHDLRILLRFRRFANFDGDSADNERCRQLYVGKLSKLVDNLRFGFANDFRSL